MLAWIIILFLWFVLTNTDIKFTFLKICYFANVCVVKRVLFIERWTKLSNFYRLCFLHGL